MNPYESPTSITGNASSDIAELDLCSHLSASLAAIVPLIIAWDYLSSHLRLLPQLPMQNWYFNVLFTVAVFVLTILSVPLGAAGWFSRARKLAAFGALLGSVSTLIVFFVKFYPVLVYYLT